MPTRSIACCLFVGKWLLIGLSLLALCFAGAWGVRIASWLESHQTPATDLPAQPYQPIFPAEKGKITILTNIEHTSANAEPMEEVADSLQESGHETAFKQAKPKQDKTTDYVDINQDALQSFQNQLAHEQELAEMYDFLNQQRSPVAAITATPYEPRPID